MKSHFSPLYILHGDTTVKFSTFEALILIVNLTLTIDQHDDDRVGDRDGVGDGNGDSVRDGDGFGDSVSGGIGIGDGVSNDDGDYDQTPAIHAIPAPL